MVVGLESNFSVNGVDGGGDGNGGVGVVRLERRNGWKVKLKHMLGLNDTSLSSSIRLWNFLMHTSFRLRHFSPLN